MVLAIAAVQVAMAAGAPWGGIAWGGREVGILGGDPRVASAVAAIILAWMALVMLARGGVIRAEGPVPSRHLGVENWAIAGLMAIDTAGNLASGNLFEQLVVAPMTAALTLLAVILARRGVDPAAA
jgi:hypothetical protein